jgi:hypothetical protein
VERGVGARGRVLSERVGVLAADEPGHRDVADAHVVGGPGRPGAVHDPLADRRHELLVLAGDRAAVVDEDLAVEQGPRRAGATLAHTDDGGDAVLPARLRDRVDGGPGHLYGVLEQPLVELHRAIVERQQLDPAGVPGHEALRERDHGGSTRRRVGDEPHRLVDGRVEVEEDRCGLDRRDLEPHDPTSASHRGRHRRALSRGAPARARGRRSTLVGDRAVDELRARTRATRHRCRCAGPRAG